MQKIMKFVSKGFKFSDVVKNTSHPSWNEIWDVEGVEAAFEKALMMLKVLEMYEEHPYYPIEFHEIFRFMQNDVSEIKFVIIGQDPYPTTNKEGAPDATGRAFEVRGANWDDKGLNRSLQNILKALYYNYYGKKNNIDGIRNEIQSGHLDFLKLDGAKGDVKSWYDATEKYGVIWLNAALTVKPGRAGSHLIIWEEFIGEVLKFIKERVDQVSWYPLGKEAMRAVANHVGKDKAIDISHPATANDNFKNCFSEIFGNELRRRIET